MKIEMELKDNPRGRPTVRVVIDQKVHTRVQITDLVRLAKLNHPWVKIIDLRIDLR